MRRPCAQSGFMKNVLLSACGILIVSCASSVKVEPQIAKNAPPKEALELRGTLSFSGGRDFLPPALATLPTQGKAQPIFVYEYFDRYRETTIPAVLALYNPFSLVGFPSGTDTVRVAAHLEIRVAGKSVRTYSATGVIKNTRNAFTGSPLAELRRRALIAVRENIQQQMRNDADAIAMIIENNTKLRKGFPK